MSSTEELPQAGDIEVEYDDLYRQDEEQAYVTLMSQEVASLNFAAEANYTVRLCKEIVHFHNPEEMPMGSFELIASNKVRSDEETLGEIFNGSPYAVDADVDPHADWVPRAEQVFDEKKLMQLSIWKKYWDEDEKAYEAIDLAYKPYGPQQTREWSKLGYLDEKGHLRTERELIESGALTDETQVANWHKKVALVKLLRDEYCVREKHAWECADEVEAKDDVDEAVRWLEFHKEKDFGIAKGLKEKKAAGDEVEVVEESDHDDDEEERLMNEY